MKICLAMPTQGHMRARCFTDLPHWLASVPGADWMPCAPEGPIGPHNRWLAAQMAVERHCDYLWFVGTESAMPPDALPRLLAHDKPIVGAAYAVKMRNSRNELYHPETLPPDLFVCAALELHCTLIKLSALREVPQPWFAYEWDADGCVVKDDAMWFCEQALSVGIQTWCDPTLTQEVRDVGQ